MSDANNKLAESLTGRTTGLTSQEKLQALNKHIESPDRELWMSRRQALIMELGAIEDFLGMPRSIVPKRKKAQQVKQINLTLEK